MKKFWYGLGIITFWVTWPGLWLVLRWSHRTRLLLVCEGEFLVLRGWLGSGTWGLPGGGLHRHEEITAGLLREVKEEIGVTLLPSQVAYAFNANTTERGLKFNYHAFVARVSEKPVVKPQPREIAAIEWQSLKRPSLPLNQDAKTLLAWWLNQA